MNRGAAIRPAALGPLLALVVGLSLAGCGGGVLTTGQMRTRAIRICARATRRTNRIATPTGPSGGERFLSRGIVALTGEVVQLRALHASGAFHAAVNGTAAELAALRLSLNGLRAGNDPVVALKTLQEQLAPLELRADEAWDALGIPACASR